MAVPRPYGEAVGEPSISGRGDGPRFAYTVVASDLHDAETIRTLTAPVRTMLDSLGGVEVSTTTSTTVSGPLLYVAATGGTERTILDLTADRRVMHGDEPVAIVAHRAHNSLPAALETMAAVHQQGGRGRIVFLSGADPDDRDALHEAVGDLETAARLRSTRLGIVGGPSSWLVASSPDPTVVRRRWGPEVVTVDPSRMIELTRTPVVPSGALAERIMRVADPVRSTVDDRAVADAAAVRGALDDVVDEHELTAVTVRCFDLLGDPGTSGCVALAQLNDDGLVAGCEGDVPSTLAMLLVRYLLDQPSWMANPAIVDEAGNTVVLAHCTVAPSMVTDVALDTHFESGRGVGIAGRFAAQPVTLLRLGGRDLDECWIAEGDIVASGADPDLCRTQVTVALADRRAAELLERPLGNHVVLARGRHGARLARWWRMVIADR